MVGYQTYATHPDKELVASYTEGATVEQALERCILEFPLDQGWTDHHVQNLETMEITYDYPALEP